MQSPAQNQLNTQGNTILNSLKYLERNLIFIQRNIFSDLFYYSVNLVVKPRIMATTFHIRNRAKRFTSWPNRSEKTDLLLFITNLDQEISYIVGYDAVYTIIGDCFEETATVANLSEQVGEAGWYVPCCGHASQVDINHLSTTCTQYSVTVSTTIIQSTTVHYNNHTQSTT